MARNGCGQSGHSSLKLAVSQDWNDEMNWFFAWWCKFRKAKSYFNDFWVDQVKNGCGHLVHETLKFVRVSLWIELISCMLTMTKNLLNGPKIGFLNWKKNLVINFHRICSIMNMFIISCVPVQILCLGKILFVRYRPKYSQPIKLHKF